MLNQAASSRQPPPRLLRQRSAGASARREFDHLLDTIADIRPGSYLKRGYEERQRKPVDLEAQEGRRPIAIHALENLAHLDTGIVMVRRLLREQLQRIEQGLDPINIVRDPHANRGIPTNAWNTILTPAGVSMFHETDA